MTDFILEWMAWGGYFGIFLLMALENVIPPIPSEVIMGLAGMAVARGDMSFWPLVLIGTAGTTAGNYFWYWVGRHVGYQRFRPFVERHARWLTLEWEDVEALERFFRKHGQWVVFFFRFLPTFRTMVSLPAGMAPMPLWRFLLFTFVGSTIWNGVLAGAGLFLGSRFSELERYMGPLATATMAFVVIGYLWRVIRWKPRDRE
jgi:membrane protein DedA with SNARE-associated domain